MRARAAALASEPDVESAAQTELSQQGSALRAVLAGFFAAAGTRPSVLLSPLAVLLGGIGSGVHLFDGRLRQPGLGAKRPRGFQPGETIPVVARVAVPMGVSAAAVAHAHSAQGSLASLAKVGARIAQQEGASARARVLERIAEIGSTAFSEPSFVRALMRVAGPSEQGLITAGDFGQIPELTLPVPKVAEEAGFVYQAEAGPVDAETSEALGTPIIVAAVDVSGVCAAACFYGPKDGVPITELELMAPFAAVPVRRGVTRVTPGTALGMAVPLAVRANHAGQMYSVSGTVARTVFELYRDPQGREVTTRRRTTLL